MPAIQNTSVSYDQIERDIIAYIQAKPQAQSWNDFYASSAGQIVVELIAGLSAYERFAITSAIRETYLAEARLRSSVTAIAQTLGYSAGRGQNQTFSVTFTPATSSTVLRFAVVGSTGSATLVAAADTILVAGTPVTMLVVAGTVLTETLTTPSALEQPFRFIQPNVSEDYTLALNGVVIPTSYTLSDLAKDQWVVLSNPVGSVDAYYFNSDQLITRTLTYATGSALTLSYIPLDSTINATTSQVSLTVGAITSVVEVHKHSAPQALDVIRVAAPYSADVQHVVRGREDYAKLLLTLLPTVVATTTLDISPAVVSLSYRTATGALLTAAQKAQFLVDLDPHRPFGVTPPTITDPITVNTILDVSVYLKAGATATAALINTDLLTLWATTFRGLGLLQDPRFFAELEADAELNLAYVKAMTVTGPTTQLAWNAYTDVTANLTLNVTLI